MFSLEHVMQMSYKFWTVPREAFCWLNSTKVIVVSTDKPSKSHCELVDIVSKYLKLTLLCISVKKQTQRLAKVD